MNIEDKELAMLQRSQRRKDIIKNITIVFLLILLALTLFSRTIMNLTLPEVATHAVTEGEVSPRIRGQGTAEVQDPYTVSVTSARTIKSVAVRVDQDVKRGDVLYYLEDTESEELRTAKQELLDAQTNFTRRIFDGTLSDSDITRLRAGNYRSDDELQSVVGAINRRFEAAQREKTLATAEYEKINAQYQAAIEEEDGDTGTGAGNGTGTDYGDDDIAEASATGSGRSVQGAGTVNKSAASVETKASEELSAMASTGYTGSRKIRKLVEKMEKSNLRKLEA